MRILSSLGALLLSCQAFAAYDFSEADALFAKRGESFQAATAARNAYASAFSQVSGDDLIYAATQTSRLDIYRGDNYNIDNKARRSVYDACLGDIDRIKSDNQVYYYYYVSCVGLRGKYAANAIDRARWGVALKAVEGAALNSTRENGVLVGGFEAGGVLRALAGIRANFSARLLGLFDPNQAVEYATLALESEGGVYRPFPDFLSGYDYYENHYYLVYALIAKAIENSDLSVADEAKTFAVDTIEEINELESEDSLPKGREVESRFSRKRIQGLKASLDRCLGSSDWKNCLQSSL